MSSAKVILVSGTTPIVSSTIKRLTNSPYSHVGFAFDPVTVEADFGGVQQRKLPEYPWPYDLYEIKGITSEKEKALLQWCLEKRGTRYDYGKVLGLGLELAFHWTGWRSLLDSKKALHCAEFVLEGLREIGVRLVTCEAKVTPALISLDPALARQTFNIK